MDLKQLNEYGAFLESAFKLRSMPIGLKFCETLADVPADAVFPTKDYGEFSFPSGEYTALRLVIGAGEGENWWCVLFPPLCLSAATADVEATCLSAGLTEEQYRMISESGEGKYRLRFKILEVAQGLWS